jgi:hypothetical protein
MRGCGSERGRCYLSPRTSHLIQRLLEDGGNGRASATLGAVDVLQHRQHGLKSGDLGRVVRAGGEGGGQAEGVSSLDGGGQLCEILRPWGWAGAGDLGGGEGSDAVAGAVVAITCFDAKFGDEGGDLIGVGDGTGLGSGGDGEGQDGGDDDGGELHFGLAVGGLN